MIEYNPDAWNPNFTQPVDKTSVQYRPLVYVSCPKGSEKSEPVRMVRDARKYCELVLEYGGIPVCPTLEVMPYGYTEDDTLIDFARRVRISRCDEVWVFDEEYSPSMVSEILYARDSGKTIRHITRELQTYVGLNPYRI